VIEQFMGEALIRHIAEFNLSTNFPPMPQNLRPCGHAMTEGEISDVDSEKVGFPGEADP
jgi:hypothetical protein